MPHHTVTLPDIEQSVARPVIFSILSQIFAITKLSKDTHIYYHGKTTNIQTPGTSIDDKSRDARFGTDRYTFVEVNESYQIGALQETHVQSKEHAPVFQDEKIGLELRPVYTTSDVVINIRYRATSETEVKRWMADMVTKAARGRDINLHSVNYTYPLPYPFIELIEDAWRLREAVAGYGDDFPSYLTHHSTDRLTVLANRGGNMRHLAVKETQTRIIGLFDFSGIPEAPTKDSGTGTWEIVFSYKFSYQRPDEVYVKYPILVHNQLMPDKYLPIVENPQDHESRATYYSSSYEALSMFEGDKNAIAFRPPNPYIRLPEFDDFHVQWPHKGTGTLVTAMTSLDEGRRDLLSLKDLGDYVIDSDVMEFLQGEIPYMLKLYHSLFFISVYEGDETANWERFEITEDMMLRSKEPLDPRKVYHVRISLVIDISLLLWDALLRLSKFPKAFVKILAAINDLLRTNPAFIDLWNNKRIEPWELSYAYWILTGGRYNAASDSYVWNDAFGACGRTGDKFLNSVPKETVDKYLRDKLRGPLTVQNLAILVRPNATLCG